MSEENESPAVLTDVEDKVATVTINRPEKHNALSGDAVEGLIEAFEELSDRDDVTAIVLTGAGDKSFCSGGDMSGQQAGGGMLSMHEERGRFADLLLAMNDCKRPIVSRINGYALGGGFGLLLKSDIAIASEEATIGTPEIEKGLFPMMILAVIQRNMGRKRAMEMMLTGQKFDGNEAEDIGIVNYAVPDDELDNKVDEIVGKITDFSPAILGLGRQAFYETQDMHLEEALQTLHKYLTLNTMTEDAAEGIMAYMQDREPEWNGK
jgi:enoyl-CoA hydratase/carnithine racemase